MSSFAYKILCKSGLLTFGRNNDFLAIIEIAKREKARWALMLPSSTLRVQILCPNGQRVRSDDIKAALRALTNLAIRSAVVGRLSTSAGVTPTALASTERTAVAPKALDGSNASSFRQAGVVAPPDSPDLGNPVEVASVAVEV